MNWGSLISRRKQKGGESLKTVQYHLESKPEITVNVLPEYYMQARGLIGDIVGNAHISPMETYPFLDEHPPSLRAAMNLNQYREDEDKLPLLKDRLCLNTCLHGAEVMGLSSQKEEIRRILEELSAGQ